MDAAPQPDAEPAIRGWRGRILWFDDAGRARVEEDGLLVVQREADGIRRVQALGHWPALAPQWPGLAVRHHPGRLIAPGAIDGELTL